jgi:hypothetical protein
MHEVQHQTPTLTQHFQSAAAIAERQMFGVSVFRASRKRIAFGGGEGELGVTLRERLEQLVRSAPRGTLIPVEGLTELIEGAEDAVTDLAVEDVGRLAAETFGRKSGYSPGAIRKWIRSGLRGVRLRAYASGSGYRVRPRDFEQFVADVRAQKQNRPPRDEHVAAGTGLNEDDLDAELRAGQQAYAASMR